MRPMMWRLDHFNEEEELTPHYDFFTGNDGGGNVSF